MHAGEDEDAFRYLKKLIEEVKKVWQARRKI